jgi:ferredoxin
MWSLIGNRLTGAFWQEMLMIKEGAFTGCSACVNVCPVGEDYQRLGERGETAIPQFTKSVTGGVVEVENLAKGGAESLS